MLISEALSQYPEDDLNRLARDKVDEVANLRLPREVLVSEISAALSSLSYVARVLAPARPPTYAFLKLLLNRPDRRAQPHEFRQGVMALTNDLTKRAESEEGLAKNKDYGLYLRMLFSAWEDDGSVDRSEALLLAALRKELGIWMREHLLLEHHPMVRPIWDSDRAYAEARNHLLATGIVLVHDGDFVLPDEVALQVRRTWEIELEDAAYERLLNHLTHEQLHRALEEASLPLSGSKAERIERIVQGLVPPAEALDTLHIDDVKTVCRSCSLPVSAAKAELIGSLVDHFDSGRDEMDEGAAEVEAEAVPEPEPRELEDDQLRRLLDQLTVDLLYDILAAHGLRRSGSKAERIDRLIGSPWAESTLLGALRRADLAELCRKLDIPVSGVKRELIERLVEWSHLPQTATSEEREEEEVATSVTRKSDDPDLEEDRDPGDLDKSETLQKPGDSTETAAPTDLPWIQERFPDLEADEQIVLALLREARSLNEREIDRAAKLHRLGWFLTKAHMANLLAKLQDRERNPLRIRSTGRSNIYEWIGSQRVDPADSLGQRPARDLIDALRKGVVPDRYLDRLVVGQERARQHLTQLLDHVADRRSEFKFVRGAYGAGKTFLCSWLREQAFRRDFATSTVRIGPDQPLSDLPVFFTALVDGLRTPEKRNASALADLLESWLLSVHQETAQEEKLPAFAETARQKLRPMVEKRIEEDLASLSDLAPGFGPAVRSFYRARLQGDHETASTALAWLRGSRSLPASSLSKLGIRGQLAPEQVFPRMRALLQVIAGGRLSGLLLVIDELELVRRFPRARQRERAYETLRLLIDECGENDLPGCLLVCTGTDQLFEDEQYGLASYRALAHRVSPPQAAQRESSVRQPIVNLEPLDRDRLLEVAVRVRDLHARAYEWPAQERVAREILDHMVEDWTAFGEQHTGRLPRPFLREVVHLLDLCEERPEVSAEEFLPAAATDLSESAESVVALLDPS